MKSAEFGLIFDKTSPKEAKERYSRMMSHIAKEHLLSEETSVFCAGCLDYENSLSDEINLIRQSEDSGIPLYFHQNDEKSVLRKGAKKSDFIKGIENLGKYIAFNTKPDGFVEKRKIKDWK